MANRPEIRAALKARGVEIPPDTWFLGAEHDTCDEAITWYDAAALPPSLAAAFDRLFGELQPCGDLCIGTSASRTAKCSPRRNSGGWATEARSIR